MSNKRAVLLIHCPDQKGIISKVSEFVFRYDANIVKSDQYSTYTKKPKFLMRLEFCYDDEHVSESHLKAEFAILAKNLKAEYEMYDANAVMNMGILVSKFDHCLVDLIYRWKSKELPVNIPFVISNHEELADFVKGHGIPFYHIPVSKDSKAESEKEILSIVKDKSDFLILARYMQILTDNFLKAYNKDIINIHHSFLPSFKGSNPYKQAYNKGVKIIGATAHYVTADLDEGPIIEQVVEHVSHIDNVNDLKRKGKNLEKIALSNAIFSHIEHRIITYKNKTIVFK